MIPRSSSITRKTNETDIVLGLSLDGTGRTEIRTGLGFLDHMLTAFAKHARVDLELECDGDLRVDDHHTVEDCALALGQAIDAALGDRSGIQRFGWALAPLDESLARVSVDISGRPVSSVDLALKRDTIGDVACENIVHFFESLAVGSKMTLHVDLIRGVNDHHKAEAAFKAFALAFRQAVALNPGSDDIPSTKGTLT